MDKLKKIKIPYFIGKQLSRLKLGQAYYAIIVSTISALSLVSLAFEDISIIFLIIIFPCIFFGAFALGYLMDKSNVVTMDQRKTVEMSHRYINKQDYKANEFSIVLITALFKWMESIQNKEPIDFMELKKEYKKFTDKWKPPDEHN